jgi:hypothetical protein
MVLIWQEHYHRSKWAVTVVTARGSKILGISMCLNGPKNDLVVIGKNPVIFDSYFDSPSGLENRCTLMEKAVCALSRQAEDHDFRLAVRLRETYRVSEARVELIGGKNVQAVPTVPPDVFGDSLVLGYYALSHRLTSKLSARPQRRKARRARTLPTAAAGALGTS